jgi:hypothetical protein
MYDTNTKLTNIANGVFWKAQVFIIKVTARAHNVWCQGTKLSVLLPANVSSTNYMLHFVRYQHADGIK